MKKLLLVCMTLFVTPVFAASGHDWNVRTSPLAWTLGPNIGADYGIDGNWSVGLEGGVIDREILSVSVKGSTVGARAVYAFDGTFQDGWYVSGGLAGGNYEFEAENSLNEKFSSKISFLSLRAIGGYGWYWDNFNIGVGLGAQYSSIGTVEILDNAGTKVDEFEVKPVSLAGEFNIGFSF